MYNLRQIRKRNPNIKIAIFSRNGVPCARIDENSHVHIKNQADVDTFERSLRQVPPIPTPRSPMNFPGGQNRS